MRAVFFATLIFFSSFNSQDPAVQESPELQEASTLSESIVKLFNQHKYDEALPLAKRALEIREKLLPRTDPRISSSLTNLGEIYLARKDYKPARETFQRLLQIQEEVFGPEDVNLAFTLDRLALLHFAARNSRETEAAYKRALALREKSLGPDDPQVAQSWFNLGEFYRFERDLKPALESYRKAITVYGKLGASSNADFERASEGFQCLAYDHDKAELFKELQEIRKQFGGLSAPELGAVLNGRALSLPKPEYSRTPAERGGAEVVVVKVEIDESGKVISAVDMCKGSPRVSAAAVAAAWKARFSPTLLRGQPVKVKGIIRYSFR
ncbi:MAG TPA: tetratricopeptide repeat protein [Pyrinomonadaceae bacterium]|nr:tetratricopeptide repeat protein [Pyrinomonadaceae bacterium]